MNRVLIRAGRPPHDTTPIESAFAWRGMGHYASNTGNMLFSDAVYEVVNTPGTEVTCDGYELERRPLGEDEIAYLNEHYDRYLIPLANAIRPGYAARQLLHLADVVERLTIPVVVTGIGGQSTIGGDVFELPEEERRIAQRFVAAVLERSTSIGVRGESTRQALLDLGFPDSVIDIVGCPSMLRNGREFRVERTLDRLTQDSRVAFNAEAVESVAPVGTLYRDNEAAHPGIVSVYQTLSGGQLVLWGRTADDFPEGVPASIDHPAYQEGRLRFFTNPRPWYAFMAGMDFAFGTRIHGNVAALTAGTPAFVLTVDSRVQELCDYHAIPSARLTDVMRSGRHLARDLYEACDLEPMNARLPETWDRWLAFLERNGIEHVHQPGRANPEYAERVATAPYPRGAGPLVTADPVAVASRIAWLWGNRESDMRRPGRQRFRPDLPIYGGSPRTHLHYLTDLDRQVREDRRRIATLERQVKAQRAGLRSVRAQVREVREAQVGRRVRRVLRRAAGRDGGARTEPETGVGRD